MKRFWQAKAGSRQWWWAWPGRRLVDCWGHRSLQHLALLLWWFVWLRQKRSDPSGRSWSRWWCWHGCRWVLGFAGWSKQRHCNGQYLWLVLGIQLGRGLLAISSVVIRSHRSLTQGGVRLQVLDDISKTTFIFSLAWPIILVVFPIVEVGATMDLVAS